MRSDLRVIVAQLGARRRYAVPRMLEASGALESLYTDLRVNPVWDHVLGPWMPGALHRRVVCGVPSQKIRSSAFVTLAQARHCSDSCAVNYRAIDRRFGDIMRGWGTGKANLVYGMFGSGTQFWRQAREAGLKVVGDMFINPAFNAIVQEERIRFPDWEDSGAMQDHDAAQMDLLCEDTIRSADTLICPSETVADGVRRFLADPERSGRIACPRLVVVPYGIDLPAHAAGAYTQTGRIIFAGGADLRKGIPYFAEAARLLSGRAYSFRVAGAVTARIRQRPETAHLSFLGHLDRRSMDREYQQADVVVLPTLAEGSPAVVHEALALGIPVITTAAAGSAVRHGQEGFIVSERDGAALADAIAQIVTNRPLRKAMALAARKRAEDYTEARWGQRLVETLESVHA